jgi:hypothetical protein
MVPEGGAASAAGRIRRSRRLLAADCICGGTISFAASIKASTGTSPVAIWLRWQQHAAIPPKPPTCGTPCWPNAPVTRRHKSSSPS